MSNQNTSFGTSPALVANHAALALPLTSSVCYTTCCRTAAWGVGWEGHVDTRIKNVSNVNNVLNRTSLTIVRYVHERLRWHAALLAIP